MANHQTNFTSNFGEMGETGNAAFVLNVNGVSHTYHPIGSDVSVDVATVRRILATAPNLAQSIAAVLTAGGYPILAYDGSEYGYIRTTNNRYVFTCLDSLNGVKQAEVDTQDGTITAGAGGVDGVSILTRTDSDLFLKITTVLTLGRMPIILDNGTYYHLIAKTATVAQFGRITAAGALEVLTVNSSDQIASSSFTFVQDPYYVHTDNNFTDAYKTAVEANTTARHTHANKSVLDGIEQTDIDNWDGKLSPTGDASNTTSTFTKASGDTSATASGSKLSAIFTAISNFFASFKALAFKDTASYDDLSSGVQSSLDKADSALQSHQSVTDNNPTLAWGSTSTVGTVGSTDLRVTMPANPAQNLPAPVITSGTFGTDRIADDAITADKVKDNETLPVNIDGTATHLSYYGLWNTWAVGSYNPAKPYVDVAEVTINNLQSDNNGAGEMFQLEFGNTDIARFRLDFKINGGNVDRSNVVILESTWSKSALSNRLSVSYFKYDNDNKLAIRIYIKFTALWEVFRIRQLDAQTGDSGFINWKAATLYSGRGEGVSSPVGTNATMIYNLVHTNNAEVGSTSTPVYVDSSGQVQPCLLSLPSTTEYIDLSVSSDDLVIEDGHVYVFGFIDSSGGSVVRRLFCTSTTADVRAQIVIRKDAPGTSCCMVDLVYDSAYVNSQSVASYNVYSNNAGIVLNLHGRRMTINNVTYDYFEVTKQEGYLQ